MRGPSRIVDGGALAAVPNTMTFTDPNKIIGTHSETFLRFETPCGTGLMTHPSVVDSVDGFGGFRYWMTGTPYDGVDDSIENPCVYASVDGTTWQIPPGASNPVAPRPPRPAYNSDAHLILDDDVLHLWYRRTDDGFDTILHSHSIDGRTWAEFTSAARVPQNRERMLSPTILRSKETWLLYTVKFIRSRNLKVVQRRESKSPHGPWGQPTDCTVDLPDGRLPWHVDVQRVDSEFWMIVADSTSNRGGDLYFAVYRDGLDFSTSSSPMLPRHSRLGSGLYRSSMVSLQPDDPRRSAGVLADVWYSIVDGRRWGIARGTLLHK